MSRPLEVAFGRSPTSYPTGAQGVDRCLELAGERSVAQISGWATVTLDDVADIEKLGKLFVAAYAHVKAEKLGSSAA